MAETSKEEARHGFKSGFDTGKALAKLWFAGVKDAICLHRCIVFFVHDKEILVKTARCFALNGLIFLGSILAWEHVLSPSIRQLLVLSLAAQASERYVNLIHSLLCAVFGLSWLIPVYMVSFPLSCIWYQEIAELAFRVSQQQQAKQTGGRQLVREVTSAQKQKQKQKQDVAVQLAQELYRAVLFAVFFLQTYAVGLIPYIGGPANFVLLSWLNALYSFDYKWSLTRRSLQERMHFFEHHWAFFAGFGSVCTLATLHCSFFSGAAILAMIYPLSILTACDSDPLSHFNKVAEGERAAGRPLRRVRLPIFLLATQMTSWIISHSPEMLKAPQLLWRWRWKIIGCIFVSACCIVAASFVE